MLANQLMSFIYDPEKSKLVSVMDHDDFAMAFWQALRAAKYTGNKFAFSFLPSL
jgi:hypothetical protein